MSKHNHERRLFRAKLKANPMLRAKLTFYHWWRMRKHGRRHLKVAFARVRK